jgi:hypothetical protein
VRQTINCSPALSKTAGALRPQRENLRSRSKAENSKIPKILFLWRLRIGESRRARHHSNHIRDSGRYPTPAQPNSLKGPLPSLGI